MIELKDISYEYSNGTPALEKVSAKFPGGTISAVLGESGSGKTTLLRCIGRFLTPHRGEILCEDRSILSIPELEFRRLIGLVFQDLYLFPHLTILENLMLAPVHVLKESRKEADDHARETLTRLGIESIADSYPSQISGGQAQRAAIARGLLLKPQYMLLDEPTSALDAGTTGEFAEWLRGLKAETNFIVVTHDIPFVEHVADDGIVLLNGEVRVSGSAKEILQEAKSS